MAVVSHSGPSERIAVLPARHQPPSTDLFVGRHWETGELLAQFDRVVPEGGRLALLVGEAGAGKSRLALELAREVTKRRALVVRTRCWDRAPASSPWLQVVTILNRATCERSATLPGPPLMPAPGPVLLERLNNPPWTSPSVDSSCTAGPQVVEPLIDFLADVATERPVLLVLEDLHWAGRAALKLLQSLSHRLPDINVLVLGTYRTAEAAVHPHLLSMLERLPSDTLRIPLAGLHEGHIAQLLHAISGCTPAKGLAAEILRQTEGNPFFVTEVARLLMAQGLLADQDASGDIRRRDWELPIPSSVQEMMRAQMSKLSAPCAEAMAIASVLGAEFDLATVEAATSCDLPRVSPAIDEATLAGIIVSTENPNRYRFRNALIHRAVYRSLGLSRRRDFHSRVGEALERSLPASNSPASPLVAQHLALGASASNAEKAIDYISRAGDEASRRNCHEEAEAHYATALTLCTKADGDLTRRCELMLRLGDMQAKMSHIADARATFKNAANLSREIGSLDQFARAAIGLGGRLVRLDAIVDTELISLLEEALDRAGPTDSPLRATLLARLSRALHCAAMPERRASLTREALAMAHRLDDEPAQIAALHSRFWTLSGPEDLDDRLAVATDIVRLAEKTGDPEMALQGHHWRAIQLAEAGDMAAAANDLRCYKALAQALRQPLYLWFSELFSAMQALFDGHLETAERHVRQALVVGEDSRNPFSRRYFYAQLSWLRCEQGRLDELPVENESLMSDGTTLSRVKWAFRCSVLDRRHDATADFDALAAHDFADIPHGITWSAQIAMLSDVCSYLGDETRARVLYNLLAPYSDRNIVVGALLASSGSASHYLGVLAACSRDWEDAFSHFEHALLFNARMGARCRLARTQYEYARALLLADKAGGKARARDLLIRAATTATQLGMAGLAESARSLTELSAWTAQAGEPASGETASHSVHVSLTGHRAAGATSDRISVGATTDPPPEAEIFTRHGDFWSIRFAGRSRVVKDTKGLRYIHHLLRHPGKEFHVLDLAILTASPSGGRWPRQEAVGPGDGTRRHAELPPGEPLDHEAKRQYRQRLEDLREELVEAERFNDLGRVAKAQDEIDFLTAELSTRYLRNSRTAGWDTTGERVRKAVTNRIHASIQKLNNEDPALGEHLSKTIRTGTFCGYLPEGRRIWSL